MTGITLNENCPNDCPVDELIGQMKHKSSRSALEAYNSFFEIRDLDKNKKDLDVLDSKIDNEEKKFKKMIDDQEKADAMKDASLKKDYE